MNTEKPFNLSNDFQVYDRKPNGDGTLGRFRLAGQFANVGDARRYLGQCSLNAQIVYPSREVARA